MTKNKMTKQQLIDFCFQLLCLQSLMLGLIEASCNKKRAISNRDARLVRDQYNELVKEW